MCQAVSRFLRDASLVSAGLKRLFMAGFKWKREAALAKGTEVSQAEGHALMAGTVGRKRALPLLRPQLPPLRRKSSVCNSQA